MERLRLDKWLWAARFYKTRSLATEEIVKGRVQANGQAAKPSREIKAGDTVIIRQGPVTRTFTVLNLSDQRGPAPVAQQLYAESEDSVRDRERDAEQRRLGGEPAQTLAHGRPTKRDRRAIEKAWREQSGGSLER